MAEPKTLLPNTPLRFLWHVTKPHKWWAFSAMLAVTFAAVISSAIPFIFKMLIDGVTASYSKEIQLEALILWGTIYILTVAVVWFFWRVSGFTGMHWVTKSDATGYHDLYGHVTSHSHNYFLDRFAGSTANKISHAAHGTAQLIEDIMWGYWERILGLIVATGLMLYTDLKIGLVFLGLIVVLLCINIPLIKYRRPFVITHAVSVSTFTGVGIDILSNISAVRQYSRREEELERIRQSLDQVRTTDIRQWKMSEWGLVLNQVLIVVALGTIVLVLVRLFQADAVSTGDIVLVLTLVFASSGSLIFIGNSMASVVRMYGEIEEGLDDVLVQYDITDRSNAKVLQIKNGMVEWKNVTFKYGENRVFDEFDLIIPSGQRVGLVGPSGAGKTTFVSLMLRQHDLGSGEILIDGQNIAEVTQDSLRESIAVVPQEPLLFHRTIRENIAYGKPDATDNEIMAVARLAKAHEFIKDLPLGYDTLVGERGIKLSGGQKQRVAIARAMLKDAPILVLDEATSALDSESEVAIQQALHKLMEGKTVVAIAHRLSTLREMDRIIVLEGGKIVEDGSHDALLQYEGTYSRLWKHQAGGFLQE